MLLAWSRAILLQLAHPLIAAGVAEHSTFRGGTVAAAMRLHHTVRAMLSLTFGDGPARAQTLETIRAIHRRVHGRLPDPVGPFERGTPYSAEDPDLLLWVHATLLDSVFLVYDHLVSPLSATERDTYCVDAAPTAIELGAREADVPRTAASLRLYMDRMLASGMIAVGDQARELANAVLAPPATPVVWPAVGVNRLVTLALLPATVREQYGFPWTPESERRSGLVLRTLRTLRRVMPTWLIYWPEARRVNMTRHAGARLE